MSSAAVNPNLKNRCLRILCEVSSTHGILPKSYFPSGVTLPSGTPHATGGFADVWEGQLDGNRVRVKAFRIQTVTNPQKIKCVCRNSVFERGNELNLIPTRGSTAKSWGGSTFHIRTYYPFSEFRRCCPRFASSVPGCQTGILSSTLKITVGSTDYNWQAFTRIDRD